ncbi:MAG: hypothetical protein EP332_04375 [Bacteroidetes bacterium]|nr:MAG: hypothetical protein EP332_04375 [Bacteroidota bacterium]
MKISYLISLLLFLGCSFNSEQNGTKRKQVDRDSLEITALNQLLSQFIKVDTNAALRQFIPLVRFNEESGSEYEKRKLDSIESFKKQIRVNGFSVYVADSLFQFPAEYLILIDTFLVAEPEGYLIQLQESKSIPLPSQLNLEAKVLKTRPPVDSSIPGYLGFARFSRLAFNKDYSKAILQALYDPSGSGLGGESWMIILFKKNNQWIIEQKISLWVS